VVATPGIDPVIGDAMSVVVQTNVTATKQIEAEMRELQQRECVLRLTAQKRPALFISHPFYGTVAIIPLPHLVLLFIHLLLDL